MKNILLLFLFPIFLFGQDKSKLDSLNNLLESANHDTTKAKLLKQIGQLYYFKGDNIITLDFYYKSLRISQEKGDKTMASNTLNEIGIVYMYQANYKKAITYYSRALKIKEDLKDKKGIAYCLNLIGGIYRLQRDYKPTLEYWNASLKIQEEIGNKKGVAKSLGNIGVAYMDQGMDEKALELFYRALKIKEEIGDKRFIANTLGNIGVTYKNKGNYKQALEYYMKALNIHKELELNIAIAHYLWVIGELYFDQKKIEKAISYGEKGLALSKNIGIAAETKLNSELLYKAYQISGKYKKALDMHKLYIEMKDSMQNKDTHKQTLLFDFERKMLAKDKTLAIQQKEIEKQELQTKFGYTISALIIVILITLAIIIYRSYLIKVKSNQQIEEKNQELKNMNHILDEKNKDIMSNITYAKKIQDAILPSEETMKNIIPNSFIFYQPKDVVSGDFYWLYKDKEGVVYFTVGDCTGHGVSGAFMSVIGLTLLNELIVNKGITEVNDILMQMREYIIHYLRQKGEPGEARDGMDIALCKMNINQNKINYSGAYNSLYLIRDGELVEYKGSRRPVGYFIGKGIPFEKLDIDIKKGDIIYICSDGYADQFGGQKGKKFMIGKFKKLLLSVHKREMSEQKSILENTLKEWMKDHEQIDDICVMGVRI